MKDEVARNAALLKDQIGAFSQAFADEFLTRVKRRTPVITGRLRDSWQATVNKGTIEIFNDMDYAIFVEEGTHKMTPRGMLRATMIEAEQIATIAKEKAGIKD